MLGADALPLVVMRGRERIASREDLVVTLVRGQCVQGAAFPKSVVFVVGVLLQK